MATVELSGTVTATSSVSGKLIKTAVLSGSVSATSSVSGTLGYGEKYDGVRRVRTWPDINWN